MWSISSHFAVNQILNIYKFNFITPWRMLLCIYREGYVRELRKKNLAQERWLYCFVKMKSESIAETVMEVWIKMIIRLTTVLCPDPLSISLSYHITLNQLTTRLGRAWKLCPRTTELKTRVVLLLFAYKRVICRHWIFQDVSPGPIRFLNSLLIFQPLPLSSTTEPFTCADHLQGQTSEFIDLPEDIRQASYRGFLVDVFGKVCSWERKERGAFPPSLEDFLKGRS